MYAIPASSTQYLAVLIVLKMEYCLDQLVENQPAVLAMWYNYVI